jgi:F-type H+-transporting ATPase subunit b
MLVLCYQLLVQGPLSKTLAERRARTEGAVEDANKAIAATEKRAAKYAAKLRLARAEVYKAREERLKQLTADRDNALEAVRTVAKGTVGQAKAELESEAATAKLSIQASAGELANQVVLAILPLSAGGTR